MAAAGTLNIPTVLWCDCDEGLIVKAACNKGCDSKGGLFLGGGGGFGNTVDIGDDAGITHDPLDGEFKWYRSENVCKDRPSSVVTC